MSVTWELFEVSKAAGYQARTSRPRPQGPALTPSYPADRPGAPPLGRHLRPARVHAHDPPLKQDPRSIVS